MVVSQIVVWYWAVKEGSDSEKRCGPPTGMSATYSGTGDWWLGRFHSHVGGAD